MSSFKYEDVRHMLPDVDELRPVFDALLMASTPDPQDEWSGSGEVRTENARVVDVELVSRQARELASREARSLERLFEAVGRAVSCRSQNDTAGAADALLHAASLEEERGRFGKALAFARAAYRVSVDGVGDEHTSRALRRWARAARSLGDLDAARERYEEAYEVAATTHDSPGAGEAAIGLGNVLESQGRWAKAEQWYKRALETLPDWHDNPLPQHWHALLNLHITARSRGRRDESLRWLSEAEQAAFRLGDADASVFLENARGQMALWQGEFRKAEEHFRASLGHAQGAAVRVTVRLNLAESFLAQGRTVAAAEIAREAERDALVGSVEVKLAEVYRVLGRVAGARQNASAFVLFERSLELCRDRGLPELEKAMTLQAYADVEGRLGNAPSERELRRNAQELYASLGIVGSRHEWCDVFGEGHEPVPLEREQDQQK